MTVPTTTVLTTREYETVCRQDLYSYTTRCFAELEGRAPFHPNWHMEVIAAHLQECMKGNIKRLIVNLPPRHLKSLMASAALPAFWLGHRPKASIIHVTYGQALSEKFARDCRTIMTSSWHKALFSTRLTNPRAALQEMTTTAGGSRLATSVGGVLTGRGADLIIIDDPLKPDEAVSDTQRKSVNEWFEGTLYSRLNDKSAGVIIVIMQRLHEDDLVGHLVRQGGWTVLSFPAIAEVDEIHDVETIFGPRRFVRRVGEALHPERESIKTLETIRDTIGTYNFAGQYQQTPAPAGGGLVREAWFKRYDPATLDMSFKQIVQSWDTANKPSQLADYSVCTTWGLRGDHFYLLNVFRKKLGYPDLKRAVREQERLFKATSILIEDKASGTQLIQDLIEDGLSKVVRIAPDGDKIMRLHAQTAPIENGFVHIPTSAHWLADYLHELTVFPSGRYDDQVDSTAQALAWTKMRPQGWVMLEYAKQENAKRRAGEPADPMVRMLAPVGCGGVQTFTGRRITIPNDRIVEMSEEDAGPLRRAPGWTEVKMQMEAVC
jgi:predicted phage terminase large subunit-like protein